MGHVTQENYWLEKTRTARSRRKQKMIAVKNSTVLNQELNWQSTDWNKEAELFKYLLSNQGSGPGRYQPIITTQLMRTSGLAD